MTGDSGIVIELRLPPANDTFRGPRQQEKPLDTGRDEVTEAIKRGVRRMQETRPARELRRGGGR